MIRLLRDAVMAVLAGLVQGAAELVRRRELRAYNRRNEAAAHR